MKNRFILTLLCAVLACACFSGALADEKTDPAVVSVGAVSYPLSEVQAYWDTLAASYLAMGETIDSTQYDWYEQSVVDSYVKMGVLQNKLIEFGLDAMTNDDAAQLEVDAQARYNEQLEQYVQKIMQQYDRTEKEARTYAQTFMDLDGMTMEQARELALSALKEKRILDYATSDVPEPTEGEVQAFYEENLVLPSQQTYADLTTFEQNVLLYGASTYYIPSGYRYVRHILLPASDGVTARANVQEAAVQEAEQALQTAQNALYGVQTLGEDEASAALAVSEAQAALDTEKAALQVIYDECLARYAAEIEAIQTRLAAGESFDSVRADFPQDPTMPEKGYLVCADSVVWASSFRDGAMALAKVGDVSGPVCTNAGVHFLEYAADAPDGEVPLEGELLEQVKEAAWKQKRYAALEGFVAKWREEYEITTNVGLLSVPDCLR